MTTTFIESASGRAVEFLDPDPNTICIEDIALGLAMKCRFSGQVKSTRHFYSVAEHSVLLCRNFGWGNEDAFALLMHDAAEAYLCDLPTPIKNALPGYRAIEDKLQAVIDKKFGVVYSPVIDNWDKRVVLDERAQVMSKSGNDWNMGDLTPLGIKVQFWSPPEAEKQFLENFHRLYNIINKGCIHG